MRFHDTADGDKRARIHHTCSQKQNNRVLIASAKGALQSLAAICKKCDSMTMQYNTMHCMHDIMRRLPMQYLRQRHWQHQSDLSQPSSLRTGRSWMLSRLDKEKVKRSEICHAEQQTIGFSIDHVLCRCQLCPDISGINSNRRRTNSSLRLWP